MLTLHTGDSNAERNNTLPLSVGAGINAWFSDRVGLGLQGEYMMTPWQSGNARFAQFSLRMMMRLGGDSKK